MDEIVSLLLAYPAIEDTAMRAAHPRPGNPHAGDIDRDCTRLSPGAERARLPQLPQYRLRLRWSLPSTHLLLKLPLKERNPRSRGKRETPVPAPSKPFQAGQVDAVGRDACAG